MKKLLVLWACLMTLPPGGTAHADQSPNWMDRTIVGLTVGADLATQGGSWLEDQSMDHRAFKLGPAVGVTLASRFTRYVSAQTEIAFVAKGLRWDTGIPGSASTDDADYAEIPLLARANLPVSSRVEPYIYLGPAFSILLDADTAFDDGRFYEGNRNVATFDVGLMFGSGVALDVGRDIGAVTFDVRYNLGLRNVNTLINDENDEFLNRAIYLTVGYRADLATLGRLFGHSPRRHDEGHVVRSSRATAPR